MIRGTLITLGIVVVLASLTSSAEAKRPKPLKTEPGVTLSGESLRGISSRSVEQDYQTFFTGTTPIAIQNFGSIGSSPQQAPQGLLLPNGRELGVTLGNTRGNGSNATPYQQNLQRSEKDDEVKVQLQLRQ